MGVVTVHVVDDADPQQHHDFHCEVKLLISHMQYFTPYVQHLPGQDVELTVKCSLQTFGWLMAYVKSCITGVTPVMDSSNCIAILIASNFLQMAQLLKETLAYVADHILQLTAVPEFVENAASLESQLLTKMAIAIKEESLEVLLSQCSTAYLPAAVLDKDSSQPTGTASAAASTRFTSCEALVQKLYKHKLQALLREQQTTLLRCRVCQQLFSASCHKKLQCAAAAGAATRRLKQLPLHQPDPDWRFQDFLLQQRRSQPQQQQQQQQESSAPQQLSVTSWKDLFWLTWSHVVVLYCQKCNMHFPARQYTHCWYHPMAADFINDTDPGIHRCCGGPAWQSGMPLADSQGCTAAKHQVNCEKAAGKRAVELLENLMELIAEPYSPPPSRWRPTTQGQSQSTAAGAARCSISSTCGEGPSSGRASSSHSSSGVETTLPLLVKMTNRAAAAAAAAARRQSPGQGQSSTQATDKIRQSADAGDESHKGGSTANTHAAQQEHTMSEKQQHNNSGEDCGNSDDDLLCEDLLHRSANLRQFMEAVRTAARARNRGGSLLGVGSLSTAHIAAQVGVPLQATFSAGGAARPLSRSTEAQSNTWSSSRQTASTASKGLSRAAGGRVGGLVNTAVLGSNITSRRLAAQSEHHSNSSQHKESGKSVAVANRTLLLELIHEDDMYRMGLLMRKLDVMRLQPPPDGISRASGVLSAQDVCRAVNATLFEGIEGAHR